MLIKASSTASGRWIVASRSAVVFLFTKDKASNAVQTDGITPTAPLTKRPFAPRGGASIRKFRGLVVKSET